MAWHDMERHGILGHISVSHNLFQSIKATFNAATVILFHSLHVQASAYVHGRHS